MLKEQNRLITSDKASSKIPIKESLTDRLHSSNSARVGIRLLRWLLALIFIVPGFEKASGHIFRRALSDPAILPFFEALFNTGLYWRFLGLAQILAGLLLLIPRTATLGALLCLPIYINIVVLLISLPFSQADVTAGIILLLLNVGLLLWDWKKLIPIFVQEQETKTSVLAVTNYVIRHRVIRFVIAGFVLLWLLIHILDRSRVI